MLRFAAIVAILAFALYRSEQRSTKIWIICCILLNLGAILMAATMGDYDRYQHFEQAWDSQ